MPWLDLMTYLPDDILAKVDRTSMAASLEVRSPLLDQEVVHFMATVPRRLKYDLRRSKRLLRRLAARYIPQTILERPKQGFAIPLPHWLKTDLKPLAQALLLGRPCAERGYFNQDYVAKMLAQHQAGQRDLSQQLWALMMLEVWFQRWGG